MKILFVSHWSGSGGAEKALFEMIEHTHRVLRLPCACVVNWRGSLYRNLRAIGVECHVVPYRWWVGYDVPRWKRMARTLFNFPLVLVLALIVLRSRATVVYTNTFTICVGGLAARLTRRPHIWHVHEYGYQHHRWIFDLGERLSGRMLDLLTDRMVVGSEAVAEWYSRFVPRHKIVKIHNAVEIPASTDAARRCGTVPGRLAIVGHLSPGKGQEEAIRMVKVLTSRGRDVSLHVIGDTDDPRYRVHLAELVGDLGLQHRVVFTGQLPDPFGEMQAAQIVLVCSRDEAFGRTTVEGMLLRKPVVAAASGATTEIVQHGVTGLLYEPGSVDRLADAVQALLDDPEQSRKMGDAGYAAASQRFGRDRYFKIWRQVVFGVCGVSPAAA